MAIEIRELVIKAVVTTDGSRDSSGSPAEGGLERGGDAGYSEELIRQILDLLQENRNER